MRSWLLGLLIWLVWSGLAVAAPAPVYAPCVTVTSAKSGVVQEYCVPVSAANPLPITSQSGSLVATPAVTGTQAYPIFASASLANTIIAPTQNQARCTPFNWQWTSHVDKAFMSVTTVGTGPLNFALYSDAIDAVTNLHQPQTLLTDPSLAFVVTAVTNTVSVPLGAPGVGIALPKGITWACINDANAADAVRFSALNTNFTYVAGLVGAPSSSPGYVDAAATLLAYTIAIPAGTTTTNWPSFAGQALSVSSTMSTPSFGLEVATVP